MFTFLYTYKLVNVSLHYILPRKFRILLKECELKEKFMEYCEKLLPF